MPISFARTKGEAFVRSQGQARSGFASAGFQICNVWADFSGFGKFDPATGPGSSGSPPVFSYSWPHIYSKLEETWTFPTGTATCTRIFTGNFCNSATISDPLGTLPRDPYSQPEMTIHTVGSIPATCASSHSTSITDTTLAFIYTTTATDDSTYVATLSLPLDWDAAVARGQSLIDTLTLPAPMCISDNYYGAAGSNLNYNSSTGRIGPQFNSMIGACANGVPTLFGVSAHAGGIGLLRNQTGNLSDDAETSNYQSSPISYGSNPLTTGLGLNVGAAFFQKSRWYLNGVAPYYSFATNPNTSDHLNSYSYSYTQTGSYLSLPFSFAGGSVSGATALARGSSKSFNWSDAANLTSIGFRSALI